MDPLDDDPVREGARRAMGQAIALSRRIDFGRMTPDLRVSSSRYALAARQEPRAQILAYLPRGRGTLDLRGFSGRFDLEWLDPQEGPGRPASALAGGKRVRLAAPDGRDALVFASQRS